MKATRLIKVNEVRNTTTISKTESGRWIASRPIGLSSLKNRIICAWLVFTGKADALVWENGQ